MALKWVKIFEAKDEAVQRVPVNHPRLLLVNGIRICLVNHDGIFHAVQDACPHSGEWLSKGQVNYLGEVVCPWHHYQFDLATGKESRSRTRDLHVYPVRIDESGFYVGL
jgi:nitrite reductase/ring-hydroxylating ferredoxin subunit